MQSSQYGNAREIWVYFDFVDFEKAFDKSTQRGHQMGSKEGRSAGMVGEGSHGYV